MGGERESMASAIDSRESTAANRLSDGEMGTV